MATTPTALAAALATTLTPLTATRIHHLQLLPFLPRHLHGDKDHLLHAAHHRLHLPYLMVHSSHLRAILIHHKGRIAPMVATHVEALNLLVISALLHLTLLLAHHAAVTALLHLRHDVVVPQ